MAQPATIQIASRSHVAAGRLSINPNETTADAIGTTGTHGVRKGRVSAGCVRRSTRTPSETMTNAASVPMLTRLPSTLIDVKPDASATMMPVAIVVR